MLRFQRIYLEETLEPELVKRETGKYMNEISITTEYVNIVTSIRLPDLFLIKACAVLSTNSRSPFA